MPNLGREKGSHPMGRLSTHELQSIFAFIDSQHEQYLARLIDYVKRPSISAHGGERMGETIHYLEALFGQLGLQPRILPTAGHPILFGERHDAPGAPTLLIYGHYDVQPPDPLEQWITPPFEPAVRDGRLYARGVADNKGQHFAHLLALEALLACHQQLPCNVKVLLEGEEEIGSPHIAGFVREQRDLLKADLVVISDGPVDGSGRASILFGVRGIITFELHASGASGDLHSGHWGEIAPNPLWTLIQLLSTMKNKQGEITIEGFYDHVLPLTEQERAALHQLAWAPEDIKAKLGLQEFAPSPEPSLAARLSSLPSFTINGLHGGYAGPGSKTVLPHKAFALCDMRIVEAQRVDDIFAKVEAHVRTHAPTVEIRFQGGMEPSKTPLDSPFTASLQRAIRLACQEEPLLIPAMGGSLPQYVFTKILGIPVFGLPFGNPDEANHAPNENFELRRFYNGIKTSVALLAEMGNTPLA